MADSTLLQALVNSIDSKQLLEQLLKKLSDEGLDANELVSIFREITKQVSIPLSIFSSDLPPMEALCKYLTDYEQLTNKEISKLLNRSQKSIWANYNRAKGKELIIHQNQKYLLPISIFKNRLFSPLESVILYIKQTHKLSNLEIAKLLSKSPNSIAVLAKRARDKHEA